MERRGGEAVIAETPGLTIRLLLKKNAGPYGSREN